MLVRKWFISLNPDIYIENILIFMTGMTAWWVPQKSSFTEEQQQLVTDAKRHLKLGDIAGLPIGHVPRGHASAFHDILDVDGRIHCIAQGPAVQSFPLWPAVLEQGGGALVPCDYIIYWQDRNIALNLITAAVNSMPEKEVISVE